MLYVRHIHILYIDEATYLDWPALFGFITQIFCKLRSRQHMECTWNWFIKNDKPVININYNELHDFFQLVIISPM